MFMFLLHISENSNQECRQIVPLLRLKSIDLKNSHHYDLPINFFSERNSQRPSLLPSMRVNTEVDETAKTRAKCIFVRMHFGLTPFSSNKPKGSCKSILFSQIANIIASAQIPRQNCGFDIEYYDNLKISTISIGQGKFLKMDCKFSYILF